MITAVLIVLLLRLIGASELAVQPRLGLLPGQRTGLGGRLSGRALADGTPLTRLPRGVRT